MRWRLPLAGRLRSGGTAAGLALLGRALKDPARFAATAARIGALADEFARGGVVVEGHGLSTVLQADGDLQLCLEDAFRASPPERQAEALEAHLGAVEARLRPLADAAAAITLARAGLGSLSGLNLAATETARALYGELPSVEFWLPHILTLGFAVGAALAPRLAWWLIRFWLRRRMRQPDAGWPPDRAAAGAVEP
jgi:hypothetical protein